MGKFAGPTAKYKLSPT